MSEDGYRYTPLNDGKPWLPPSQEGELMRDAFLTRGPDGEFHMVWTWDWHTDKIGYAHSPDLVHWSEQIEVPLMRKIEGSKNTWAPEIYWDQERAASIGWFSKANAPSRCTRRSKIARGPGLEGPWTNIQGPFTEAWSEGPSALEIDGKYVIYYDHYRVPVRYEAIGSNDLEHWEPINDRVSFPKGCKHGSVLKITTQEAERRKRK